VHPAIYIAVALLLAALLLVLWVTVIEHRLFRVRRVVLDADRLGLPPLRILHVTDTHFHGRDGAILRFLGHVAAREDFDLVFLTGDLIDSPSGLDAAEAVAGMFRPSLGTFAVLGGHDYAQLDPVKTYRFLLTRRAQEAFAGDNPADDLVARLEAAGVRVLEDSAASVRPPAGRPFAVVGLRDAFVFEPDSEAAWRKVEPDLPVIAIAHSPDVVREVSRRGASLAFFGHTHGGQVRLPIVGAVVTRCTLPRRLVRGVFRQADTVFILNNGLGTSPAIPYRLLCRPEVTVAVLESGAAPGGLTPVKEAGLE
jgi:hypothetical protein